MEYAQVPTNLLIGDYSDAEILAIVKYQLLFSSLENVPTDKILNRFLTKKQQNLVKNYVADINLWVQKDIESVTKKRDRDSRYYHKKKLSAIEEENFPTSESTSDRLPYKLIEKKEKIKESKSARIDPFFSVDVNRVIDLYNEFCTNLIPVGRASKKTREVIATFLEEIELDFDYVIAVFKKANALKTICDNKIDLQMIINCHERINSGFYQSKDKQHEQPKTAWHTDEEIEAYSIEHDEWRGEYAGT